MQGMTRRGRTDTEWKVAASKVQHMCAFMARVMAPPVFWHINAALQAAKTPAFSTAIPIGEWPALRTRQRSGGLRDGGRREAERGEGAERRDSGEGSKERAAGNVLIRSADRACRSRPCGAETSLSSPQAGSDAARSVGSSTFGAPRTRRNRSDAMHAPERGDVGGGGRGAGRGPHLPHYVLEAASHRELRQRPEQVLHLGHALPALVAIHREVVMDLEPSRRDLLHRRGLRDHVLERRQVELHPRVACAGARPLTEALSHSPGHWLSAHAPGMMAWPAKLTAFVPVCCGRTHGGVALDGVGHPVRAGGVEPGRDRHVRTQLLAEELVARPADSLAHQVVCAGCTVRQKKHDEDTALPTAQNMLLWRPAACSVDPHMAVPSPRETVSLMWSKGEVPM